MYGYLKPDNSVLEFKVRRYYRERYCSLCHSLWNYYGILPRLILSYDVTFTSVVLDLDSQVDFNKDKLLCYKRNQIVSNEEEWKGLAAISILLAAGKLRDNIADEHSTVAKLLLTVYSRAIKKAESYYPELSAFLKMKLENMSVLEKNNGSLTQLADAFAEMMCGAYELLFEKSEYKLAIARHVSKWIYFVDAIDDLDDDIKSGCYNPLSLVANSTEDLMIRHSEIIVNFVSTQREELLPYSNEIAGDSLANKMVRSILNDTIPKVTQKVLLKQKYNDYLSPHIRLIQAKEDVIFA